MKDIGALEEQFKTALIQALERPSPGLFALKEGQALPTGQKLRARAERIMELRRVHSVDRSKVSPAALYLMACLRWEHGPGAEDRSAREAAKHLLHALERG